METISVHELAELERQKKIELVDVRTPVEFRELHAACARNVPLDRLDPKQLMANRNGSASDPLYVICRSGGRSSQACQKILDAGYANVINVDGGTLAWDKAQLPVVRGRKAFELQRQVQICAGTLALVGAVLGYLVHPYFIGLSAFIGAGLIFAGVTNTCPMAIGLSRMPWNQVGQQGTQSCNIN